MLRSPLILVGPFIFALALISCRATSSNSVPPSSEPLGAATAAPAQPSALLSPVQPVGSKVLDDDEYLADSIGPRPAGTDKEKQAAEFIADRLRSFGFDVNFQEFTVSNESSRGSTFAVNSSPPRTIPSVPAEYSGAGSLRARLVAVPGLGTLADFPDEVLGNIALIARGEIPFDEKVSNAQAAGARGVVLFNNGIGIFYGSLSQLGPTIPVVAISQAEGTGLLAKLEQGPLDVELAVTAPTSSVSRNVVAMPPGRQCDTITGGHYDSVRQAPGASDNGSGAATVLAIAGVLAGRGEMAGNCFVFFGTEEQGLIGSKHFVSSLEARAKRRLKAMLNLDMVGVGDEGWALIGTPELQVRAQNAASLLGIQAGPDREPATKSSDHVSFLAAGIPALMFTRLNDPLLHTPRDVSARVKPELLEQAARMGIGLLEALKAERQ